MRCLLKDSRTFLMLASLSTGCDLKTLLFRCVSGVIPGGGSKGHVSVRPDLSLHLRTDGMVSAGQRDSPGLWPRHQNQNVQGEVKWEWFSELVLAFCSQNNVFFHEKTMWCAFGYMCVQELLSFLYIWHHDSSFCQNVLKTFLLLLTSYLYLCWSHDNHMTQLFQ